MPGRAEFASTGLSDLEGAEFGVFMALVLAPPVALWATLGRIGSRS